MPSLSTNLVRAICNGIKFEPTHYGILSLVYKDILSMSQDDSNMIEYDGHFVDDVSGQPPKPKTSHSYAQRRDGDLLCS